LKNLFRFDGTVDLFDEEIASIKSDGARQDEETEGHDESVSKIEEDGDEFVDLEFCEEVEDGIKEHIECTGSRGQECSPPPMIVLATKLEVAHDDGDLGASQDQNDEDNGQKSKNVVELMQPNGGQDEEQFDEDGSEGKDSSHQDREQRSHIPDLLWDLARNLVGSDLDFFGWLLESEIASKEHQWD